MGPSGAGKTTFMNCLMGKISRTGGILRINHQDLEMNTLKKVIGYVPQVSNINNNKYISFNLSAY